MDKAKSATTTGEHSSARHRLKYSILTAITVGVVFTIVIQTALRIHKAGKTELNQYEFKITRNLVKTVEHAKKLLEQKGLACMPELDEMKLSEMLSEPLDQRKIATAGIAMIFGLGSGFVPEFFAQLPHSLQPIFANPLAATTILGIICYQLFHIDLHIIAWKNRMHSAKNGKKL